ncbi:MAG TPA: hypothetical protein VL027_04250 [Spongiibacteraceae bacterium]|nr:hypothetical protein [Spongiibacteraceae bacterium]
MAKRRSFNPDDPLRHADHARPRSRREFIAQGLMMGGGTLLASSLLGSRLAHALSPDLAALTGPGACNILAGAGKIPFICFDLAGGASIAGSNVLVGGPGGQLDVLSTAGYSKLGVPGDMVPGLAEAAPSATSNGDYTDTSLGLAFHSDSAMLQGILEKAVTARANTNGAVIPARSENDTGNNPHNPMYGIAAAGARGEFLSLVGSRASESGGNSMAPASMINLELRPTKVDRPSDVSGLVDVGSLSPNAVPILESSFRISSARLGRVDTRLGNPGDANAKDFVRCSYLKAADLAERSAALGNLNPYSDPDIVGPAGIFSTAEFDSDGEFRKTASVMKLVVDQVAGAGTITMGGYDYHTGDRATGELRDLRAGRCIGACLEYAARKGKRLMIYVFSDGSVSSNGRTDDSVNGRGKGEWTSDNQSTAASFFLVYNPGSRPQLYTGDGLPAERHQQLGYMSRDGSVVTASSPAANNVNLLVETLILNYLALHGEQASFSAVLPGHGLGNAALRDSLTAFNPIT